MTFRQQIYRLQIIERQRDDLFARLRKARKLAGDLPYSPPAEALYQLLVERAPGFYTDKTT